MKLFRLLSLVFLILALFGSNVFSQYDTRKLPFYIDAEYYKESPLSLNPKGQIYWPTSEYPEGLEKKYKADRMLSQDGISLVPLTTKPGQSETWIAINPKNPKNLVAGSNDYRYNSPNSGYRMGVYYTFDGGQTWKETVTPKNMDLYIEQPEYPKGMTNFDPGITFDDEGKAYYCYGFAVTNSDDGQEDNGVFVTRSDDGGKTWNEPTAVALEYGSGSPFHDRYMIVADAYSNNPALKGNIYVAWRIFGSYNPGIGFARSDDNGESWSDYITLAGSGGATQAPTPVVGPDGEVYVAFRESGDQYGYTTKAMVQKSTNGGKAWWGSPKKAMTVYSTGTVNSSSGRQTLADKQSARVSSYPAIAVDASQGEYRSHVYVVQSGKEGSSTGPDRLFFSKSSNGGETWSAVKRIDDNALGNDIFFPSATVDPVTGMLSVLYYSSQNDPSNKKVDAYVAVSSDGGETFSNIRLTPTSMGVGINYQGDGNYYWGDYTGITSYDGNIFPCFWKGDASANFYSLYAFTALLSPRPQAPENLIYESSYEPLAIQLWWNDPVKNMLGMAMADFDIIVYRDGNEIAVIDKGIQIFEDKNIEVNKTYKYTIKAKTPEGYLSEPVSANIIAGGSPKPKPIYEISRDIHENGFELTWRNPYEHIDATGFTDFAEIRVYEGEQLVKTITSEDTELKPGEESSFLITELELNKFHKLTLRAVGKRGDIYTESDPSAEFLVYSGPARDELSEDFENSETMTPYYTDKWGIVEINGNKVITDSPEGEYDKYEKNTLILAPVKIREDKTTLSMDIIPLIDKNKDYGEIAASTDLKTWRIIAKYNIDSLGGFGESVQNNEFVDIHRYLGWFVGEPVFIRFTLSSDLFLHKDGWYIDNVTIDNQPASVNEDILRAYTVAQVYPNPAEQNASLRLELPVNGYAVIELYDALGKKLRSIAEMDLEPGSYDFPLQLAELPVGYYYCRVSIDKYTKTAPIIIAR